MSKSHDHQLSTAYFHVPPHCYYISFRKLYNVLILRALVFRELLQNSDDASASAVEIHFDTEAYLQRSGTENPGTSSDTTSIIPLPDLRTTVVCVQSCSTDHHT